MINVIPQPKKLNYLLVDPASQRRAGRRRGQSLVELAISLPFMLLLMLGTIDMGRMFFDYIELRNAAREGAGYGSRNPTDTSGIELRVTNHGIPSGTTIAVTCFPSPSLCNTVGVEGTIVVETTREFQPITTGFLQIFGIGPVTLQANASMRVLS